MCVHPDRVGLPAAPYASSGLPLPWETPPPAEAGEVPAWERAALDAAPPEVCDDMIRQATAILLASDPDTDITAVLRAALHQSTAKAMSCSRPDRPMPVPATTPRRT
ncbi:hypothetical protein NX794_32395 [Streptomyces sp. LP11]|uniref:Uncharacterized protein n=1 Tax=Streptomyces pyxinicus TaxID=2970331 RepID=A0ABT2BBS1_9ACTN|nr:hypothetical protein [Streptomyces sp. LP11]MCS0605870.1 hypothetical protein [Streptomyces sp. LP11]